MKNLEEFREYIANNEMPDMVSLDHDIRPRNYYGKHETGADVAQWLVNYCEENGIKMPHAVAHSANKGGAQHINDILASYHDNIKENTIIRISENELTTLIKESVAKIVKNFYKK